MQLSNKQKAFVRSARVARLATADKHGQPHVIPICFVFDGKVLYSPIDEKPKRSSPLELKRLRNIRANPQVAVVIDRYIEKWKKLAYVLIFGKASCLRKGPRHQKAVRLLRLKFPQYRKMRIEERPVIRITPTRFVAWGEF